jgi:hypothetical protein
MRIRLILLLECFAATAAIFLGVAALPTDAQTNPSGNSRKSRRSGRRIR